MRVIIKKLRLTTHLLTRDNYNGNTKQVLHSGFVPILDPLLHVRVPNDVYRHIRLQCITDEYGQCEQELDHLRETTGETQTR